MSKEPIKNNMNQVMDNSSTTLLFSEVLDKVHKAKTKAQKVSILKQGRFAFSANLATSDGSFALFLEDLLSA